MLFKDTQECYNKLKKWRKKHPFKNISEKAVQIALQRCYRENRPIDIMEIQDIDNELKGIHRDIYEEEEQAYILGRQVGTGDTYNVIPKEFIEDMKKNSSVAGRCFRKGLKDGYNSRNLFGGALVNWIDEHYRRYSKDNRQNDIYIKRKK